MWEYVIGYGPGQDDAPWVVEERSWASREAMAAELGAAGWELIDDQPHRAELRRLVFRRAVEEAAQAPRHLLPCW